MKKMYNQYYYYYAFDKKTSEITNPSLKTYCFPTWLQNWKKNWLS